MALDKVEAVKKVSETLSKQSMNPAEEMERMAPNKEQFQSLIDSSQPLKPGSFERIDTKTFATEEVNSIESKPVFAEENVSAQKNGSATDQERKQRQQQTDEIEEIGSASGKKLPSPSGTLMDEMGKLNGSTPKMSQMTPEALSKQAQGIISQLDQVKTQLSQAQGEIKPSYQNLLRNRLTHIDDNLKIALSKAGVEYTPPPATIDASGTGKSSPLHRFLDMVSQSQHQLENLHSSIQNLDINGGQLSQASMLAIQIKMGYVQQQIELFTNLLNKALESTKTIMNVQV